MQHASLVCYQTFKNYCLIKEQKIYTLLILKFIKREKEIKERDWIIKLEKIEMTKEKVLMNFSESAQRDGCEKFNAL